VELILELPNLFGLVFAMSRAGAFAASSPITRALPVPGRLAFMLGIGLALAEPVTIPPTNSTLIAGSFINVGIGLILGFLTGILINAFRSAGSMVDLTSALNSSAIFDPTTGNQNTVFSRLFNITAIVLWFVMGGDKLAVEGLAATVELLPLDGTISLASGLADVAVDLVAVMLVSAVQLALPALAALFLAEVGFGLASRFAPQANVFALGIPFKLVAALLSVGLVIAGFPSLVSSSIADSRDVVITAIRGMGG
jgi:flagellar biosynthetic protein FliR